MPDEGTSQHPFGEPMANPTADIAGLGSHQAQDDGGGQPESKADPKPPATEEQTTVKGPDPDVKPSEPEPFFDPDAIKDNPDLMLAYKQMQAAFTKKTQSAAQAMKEAEALREKAAAVDAFTADPVGQLQALAKRAGMKLVPATGVDEGGQGAVAQWQPESWEDVLAMAEQRAMERLTQQIAPLQGHLAQVQQAALEKQLDDIAPDWRQHEDEMVTLLTSVPGEMAVWLSKNPARLYQLSVPQEVLEARMAQKIQKRYAAKTSGTGPAISTTKPKAAEARPQIRNIEEAQAWAEQVLRERGIFRPT